MQMQEWNPGLTEDQFTYVGDLEQDLISFAEIYMEKVTPRMVKVSLGLRTPELYPYTAEGILKVPQTFKKVLIHYFNEMKEKIIGTEYMKASEHLHGRRTNGLFYCSNSFR